MLDISLTFTCITFLLEVVGSFFVTLFEYTLLFYFAVSVPRHREQCTIIVFEFLLLDVRVSFETAPICLVFDLRMLYLLFRMVKCAWAF